MIYINKKKLKYLIKMATSVFCLILAVVCFLNKIPSVIMKNEDKISTVAAGLVLPDGAKAIISNGYEKKASTELSVEVDNVIYDDVEAIQENNALNSNIEESESQVVEEPKITEISPSETTPADGEATYPIIEKFIGNAGTTYDNFSVKNTTSLDIDIGKQLSLKPDINIEKNSQPQVLIMHTHTCEAYMDKDLGYYPESYYPRTTDNNQNVVRVGEAISQKLLEDGINVIHDTTVHDNPSYNGSYYRSEDTVKSYLERYPSIQVVLDIHRDAIGNNESGKVKPTFTYDGKKAAQIMIISGCDDDGTWNFPDWEYNLRFALRLQNKAETLYPGMTRPLKFCPSQYNMNLTHGSLLIEVGSDANTIDEAVYTGELLGNVLKEVLNDLT